MIGGDVRERNKLRFVDDVSILIADLFSLYRHETVGIDSLTDHEELDIQWAAEVLWVAWTVAWH